MVKVRPRRTAGRLSVLVVVTMLLLPLSAAGAFATEPDCPDLGVVYYVNGKVVGSLHGNVSQGSTVRVEVTVPDECDPVELTLASYTSPVRAFDKGQILYQYVTDDYPGGATLEVGVPDCYFQVDFAYGPVIKSFADGDKYGKRLIDAAIGGDHPCASESPSPSETPSHSPSPSPSPSDTPTHSPSPSPSETPTQSPSPTDTPTESPGPTETETASESPSPVVPSDDDDDGVGGDDDDDEAPAAPRSTLASTGVPVLILGVLALLGIGTGSTLLHTTRRRRAD